MSFRKTQKLLDNSGLLCVLLAAVLFFGHVECVSNLQAEAGQFRGYKPHVPVEKYDIVYPEIISSGIRWRRDIGLSTKTPNAAHLDRVSFVVSGLGRSFTLDLVLNRILMPVSSKSTHFSAAGLPISKPTKAEDNCYYQGSIKGVPDSSVAVSTCNGLEGLIFDGKDSFYIEPTKQSHSKTSQLKENSHIIYQMKDLVLPHTKCGHDHLPSVDSISQMYKMNNIRRVRRNVKSETKYVELIIVNDFDQFDYFKRNLDDTEKRARKIANLVDSLYRPLNIRVALVDMVTWNRASPITVSANSDTTLDNFLKWRNEVLIAKMKKANDNAQLLTHKDFEGATVGKAHVMAMCTRRSAGVVQDHAENAAATAATFAHEMGHNLGMSHDEQVNGCKCKDFVANKGCIMSGVARGVPASTWSSCSAEAIDAFSEKGFDQCLFNVPGRYYKDAVCGNGFKEKGEECDCGTAEECKKYSDNCCNSTTCKMLPGTECDTGPCCSKCKLKSAGTQCREKVTECDLPEFCDGKSGLCPANRFVHNGRSCGDGKGYCFQGVCPTLDSQCQTLWGSEVTSGPRRCYTINVKGTNHGCCEKLPNGTFLACKAQDIYCGMLHCTNVKQHLPIIGADHEVYTYIWPTEDGGQVKCKSVILDVGNGIWNDGGMTKDGIKCGDGKMCYNRRCRNVTAVAAAQPQCHNNCNNKGICNDVGGCFCNPCWTGKDCSVKTSCPTHHSQFPGDDSLEKEQDLTRGGSSNVAVIVALGFFVLLVTVLMVVGFINRDVLKAKWQELKQERRKRHERVQKDGQGRSHPSKPSAGKKFISGPVPKSSATSASHTPIPATSASRPPIPSATKPSNVPPRPPPGKIELLSWPQEKKEDTPAAVPPVTRRPPPPRPGAPKDSSLRRASSPPGFNPSAAAPCRPAPAPRPGSLAGVLDKKPLPGIGKQPGAKWPPLNKAAPDGNVVGAKPATRPPPPPTMPVRPVLPVSNKEEEEDAPAFVKPSDIKKVQGKPAHASRPVRPPPGKALVPPDKRPVPPGKPGLPPGAQRS